MNREYEYRFYDYNKYKIINKLLEMGAELKHDHSLYKFSVFHDKKYIRVRKENGKIYLTVKVHDNIFPIEKQIQVEDYDKTVDLMQFLGFKIKYQFEKIRQIYQYKDIEIVFDMYPGIPEYMEIEAKNKTDLEKLCALLDLDSKKHEWRKLPELYNNNFGITNYVQNLTFSNMEEKLKPLVKKNMDVFEELLTLQKSILINY